MLKTLLIPTGALRPYEFLKGCIALLSLQFFLFIMVISNADKVAGPFLFSVWFIPSVALIYPYYCLYGKRLERLKLSRMWFFPIMGLFVLTFAPMYMLGTVVMTEVIEICAKHGLHKSFENFGKIGFLGFAAIWFTPLLLIMHSVLIMTGLILGSWKRPDHKINNFAIS